MNNFRFIYFVVVFLVLGLLFDVMYESYFKCSVLIGELCLYSYKCKR